MARVNYIDMLFSLSLSLSLSPPQHLIEEVADKREQFQAQINDSFEISFKFDSLVRLMSTKQEQLFQGVVHFNMTEITRIEVVLDQAERKLAESPSKGYVEKQRHLHRLKVGRERERESIIVQSTTCTCVTLLMHVTCVQVYVVLVHVHVHIYVSMKVYFVEFSA